MVESVPLIPDVHLIISILLSFVRSVEYNNLIGHAILFSGVIAWINNYSLIHLVLLSSFVLSLISQNQKLIL